VSGAARGPEPIDRELRRRAPAPDVTAVVMSRLNLRGRGQGRGRRRRLLARLAVCALATALAVLGALVARRVGPPAGIAGPTIPSALRQDLQRHGRTIEGAMSTIRTMTGAWPQAPSA
jgi:hypothetical protein